MENNNIINFDDFIKDNVLYNEINGESLIYFINEINNIIGDEDDINNNEIVSIIQNLRNKFLNKTALDINITEEVFKLLLSRVIERFYIQEPEIKKEREIVEEESSNSFKQKQIDYINDILSGIFTIELISLKKKPNLIIGDDNFDDYQLYFGENTPITSDIFAANMSFLGSSEHDIETIGMRILNPISTVESHDTFNYEFAINYAQSRMDDFVHNILSGVYEDEGMIITRDFLSKIDDLRIYWEAKREDRDSSIDSVVLFSSCPIGSEYESYIQTLKQFLVIILKDRIQSAFDEFDEYTTDDVVGISKDIVAKYLLTDVLEWDGSEYSNSEDTVVKYLLAQILDRDSEYSDSEIDECNLCDDFFYYGKYAISKTSDILSGIMEFIINRNNNFSYSVLEKSDDIELATLSNQEDEVFLGTPSRVINSDINISSNNLDFDNNINEATRYTSLQQFNRSHQTLEISNSNAAIRSSRRNNIQQPPRIQNMV